MDKEIIARNFSRCANLYDTYSDIQRKSAQKILSDIEGRGFNKILEIGCGTGNYTLLLREKFKDAKITAIDISGKMIEIARRKLGGKGIGFMVGDGESADFPDEEFDLITSNACFQWFGNLKTALGRYKRLLMKGGLISFSAFGPLTFCELSEALAGPIAAERFMGEDGIRRALYGNFNEPRMKEFTYQESFATLLDLLKKIKYSGIRGNAAAGKVYLSPRNLSKIEEVYLNKFKEIKATYQIFSCQGKA